MGVNLLTCSPLNSHAASAWYYLTDANYNVSMIVTDSGWGVERVFYTAYGEPEVFPFGDADGDYSVVDPTDKNAMIAIKDGQAPYNILADLNLDGAVTQADLNAFSAYSGALGGRNVLTASNGSATTGNDIGYAGYTWNDERSQWHVRNREYDPKLGRWLQRDPEGYVDGSTLYEYVASNPLVFVDSFGLCIGSCNDCALDLISAGFNALSVAACSSPEPFSKPACLRALTKIGLSLLSTYDSCSQCIACIADGMPAAAPPDPARPPTLGELCVAYSKNGTECARCCLANYQSAVGKCHSTVTQEIKKCWTNPCIKKEMRKYRKCLDTAKDDYNACWRTCFEHFPAEDIIPYFPPVDPKDVFGDRYQSCR